MSKSQKTGNPAGGRPVPFRSFPAGGQGETAIDRTTPVRSAHEGTAPAGATAGTAAPGTGASGPADVLRVGTPQDILAFVPHCLGFQPRESLVLLALRGSRLGATLRLDLPGPSCSGDMPQQDQLDRILDYSARVTALLSGDETADGVLAVVYTELPWIEETPPPYSALMEILSGELEDSGLRLRDAWLVGNGAWRGYFCGDGACCPWPGYPLGEIEASRLNAELVYRGSAFAPTAAESLRTAGKLRTPALDEEVERVRRVMDGNWSAPESLANVLAAWERRIRSANQSPDRPAQAPPGAGSAADGAGLTGADAETPVDTPELLPQDALLLASLESKPVRDTVLVLAAAGMEPAAEGIQQWLHPEAASSDAGILFREILIGRSRAAPDWNRMDRAYETLSHLVQRAAGEPAAALLTLLGWIEWARGRSSRAEIFLSGALREVPGYRLAALLRELLCRGELPQWAQSPSTAWQGESPV